MELKSELFLILILSSALLSASLPLYAALAQTPEEVFFGEGVYMLSQASTNYPLTDGLVMDLREQSWAVAVSPEVYAFVSMGSQPIVVRGVELAHFLRVEGVEVPSIPGEKFLLMGSRLAATMGLSPGDSLLMPGSFRPMLLETEVDGLLDVKGAPADEIVLDLPRARMLADMRAGSYHLVRVLATEGEKLFDYLASSGLNLLVGDGESNVEVENGVVTDDRIGALLLSNPDLARELGRSYINSFAKYSGNSLRVVILGMQALTLALFTIVLASSLVRFMVESRRKIGLVLSLGGGLAALLRIYGWRTLALGMLAGFLGLLLGTGIGYLLEAASSFTFLGHVVVYEMEPWTGLQILAAYAAALVFIVLLSFAFFSTQRPRDLLREVPEPEFHDRMVVSE